jgi:hypothetical protein
MSYIAAIAAVFAHDPRTTHFSVAEPFRDKLENLAARYAGVEGPLVSLYVPEATEEEYGPDRRTHGRITVLAEMLPMPAGHTVADYPSGCLEFRRGQLRDRWPFGWPCRVVFFSPRGGPRLRHVVEDALKRYDFGAFTGQFHNSGPIDLRCLPALSRELMAAVRRRVALDPATQVWPF